MIFVIYSKNIQRNLQIKRKNFSILRKTNGFSGTLLFKPDIINIIFNIITFYYMVLSVVIMNTRKDIYDQKGGRLYPAAPKYPLVRTEDMIG
jgi:hypothetical protein